MSLKHLPDLDDSQAMAAEGRRAVLRRARNEACEALRDATVACQSATLEQVEDPAGAAIDAAERLRDIAVLWWQEQR